VLVSAPPDHLVEMATVSVTALRMLSPEVKATVVMDSATLRGISGHRARLLELVDRVIEAPAQDQSPMARSRRIKTTLRELVAGDYLFLDVDAVPVKPIGAVFSTAAEFAAVYDGNMPPRQFVFHDFERQPFEAMGWPLPPGPYFNSGVKLVRDTPGVRALYREWHRIWSECAARGIYKDQPALHRALLATGMQVTPLSPQWNALIGMYTGGVRNARVMHFSTIRFEQRDDTVFHRIVKGLKHSGELDVGALKAVMESGYPWTDSDSLRLRFAVGDYPGTVRAVLRRVLKAVSRKDPRSGSLPP
jgi:hypothetical protein